MSSNLQQAIFMQRDRESKQSVTSNIQQEMSSNNVRDSKQKQWRLPSSSHSKQWPLREREREAAHSKQ
jgi:hypothetical protein